MILLNPDNPRSPHLARRSIRKCLIENKRATGREKDYLDLKGIGAEAKKPKDLNRHKKPKRGLGF